MLLFARFKVLIGKTLSLLHAVDLSCIKRDKLLFENLNVTVDAGEMLVVSGPNGAGKTSLLRILAGLSYPESGELQWRDVAISQDPLSYYRELIFVGHKLGLSINLSALENLQFWLHGRNLAISDDDIITVLDRLALVGMEDVLVGQMSAGQQRRVALAKLWLASAKIWILDEPLTALDKFGVKLLQAKMAEHVQQGGMLITTSHQAFDVGIPIRELALKENW